MADYAQLCEKLNQTGICVWENKPLALYTSFHIGGPARLFCEPQSIKQLSAALRLCQEAGVRTYLLGKGSNTLFSDAGFDGVVLHLCGGKIGFDEHDSCTLQADAGVSLLALCKKAAGLGLSGLEFAYGIPGSVGGAVYMNAGAYDGEMANVVYEVDYLDAQGCVRTAKKQELLFGYRTSRFEKQGGVILCARFHLTQALPEQIEAKMAQLLQRRADKQPLDKPSAGSTFKRPQGAYAAALIDQCKLKGFQIGNAAVSEKHAGFVVNLGGATCADVVAVANHVSAVVKEKTGYVLEREIKVVE